MDLRYKKPKNAYLIFYSEQFPLDKRENPEKSVKEINKDIALKWKALDSEDKRLY